MVGARHEPTPAPEVAGVGGKAKPIGSSPFLRHETHRHSDGGNTLEPGLGHLEQSFMAVRFSHCASAARNTLICCVSRAGQGWPTLVSGYKPYTRARPKSSSSRNAS